MPQAPLTYSYQPTMSPPPAPPAPPSYTYALRHASAECGAQSANLGHMQSAAICATTAGQAGCSSFMHSASYPVWGCRCCSRADGGTAHNLWSVYDDVT
jgi:hypothetical protein